VPEIEAIPLVVVSATRDPVEALNGLLRRYGMPVRCNWIAAVADLPDALVQIDPHLLVHVTHDATDLPMVTKVRDSFATDLPLLVIRNSISEADIAADLMAGARDSMTLEHSDRVHAVFTRELKVARTQRVLQTTLRSAEEYRSQLETVLTRSNDAIAQVQEGILVDVNQSWLELLGAPDAESVLGQPIMDCFDEGCHAALKGALAACQKGRWHDHSLRADLQTTDGSTLGLELVLALSEREGEPCIRLMVPAQKRKEEDLGKDLAAAVDRNPNSGLLHRQPLLQELLTRFAQPLLGGSRFLIYMRLDRFAKLERELGTLQSDDLIVTAASLLRENLATSDIAGHFSGPSLMALIERGTSRDAEIWAERLLEKVARHEFMIGERNVKISASIAVVELSSQKSDLDSAVAEAQDAVRRLRQRGGNQISIVSKADTDARVQSYDAVWVKHIRAALTENRFRLVQQPIVSLNGGSDGMFDILVRMLDKQGREILPSEFMPAAERNDLVSQIDRWVIWAAGRFAVRTKPSCLFVRLSQGSVLDESLAEWIAVRLREMKLEPSQLCFEITESVASQFPRETRRTAKAMKASGLRMAIEHFGSGVDPLNLLETVELDFVKIDGALMQGLTDDKLQQSKVAALVDAARSKNIETIAERVEDANTMAVLWQLGVQHLQGFLIQAPEQVEITSGDTAINQIPVVNQTRISSRSTLR
jgi:multidomain signaling protein FimX